MKPGNRFQTGNVTTISVSHMLHDIYSSFLAPLRPLLIEKFQMTLFLSSLLAALQIAGAAGTLLSGTISDKLGRKTTLLIASIAIPVSMWVFIMAKGIFVFPALLLLGFFIFAPGPVVLAMVQDIKTQRPAFFNGIYMTLNFASSSVAIVLAGWMGDLFSLQTTYMITGSAALLSVPFIIALPSNNKKQETNTSKK